MPEDGLEFFTVKETKYKKRPHIQIFEVPLSNRFEGMPEEPEESEEPVCQSNVKVKQTTKGSKWKIHKSKFHKRRKDVVLNQTTELPHNGSNVSCLSQFETTNHFQVLVNNPDEDEWIGNDIHKTEIMKIPKQRLKKCRFCNLKKRSCQIQSENCQARKKVCWFCMKPGHFPQSLCCKKRRKANKRKLRKSIINVPKSTLITKENLNLIFRTIQKLEYRINLEKEGNEENTYQDINGIIEPGADDEEYQGETIEEVIDKQTENINHESPVKKQIMKSAKYCARKFENLDLKMTSSTFQPTVIA